jgi:histone H3/H4
MSYTFDTILPTSSVLRVIKQELPPGHHINSEAKAAFSRAAAIFALYLAAAASDAARDGKRKTVTASDVYRALEEVDLPEFVDALRRDLQGAWLCLGPPPRLAAAGGKPPGHPHPPQ